MGNPFKFQVSTRIVCGNNAVIQIGEMVKSYSIHKAMLITDTGVAVSGVLERIAEKLEKNGIATFIFDEVEPNPRVQTIDRAAGLYGREGCDGVIAIGGGSSMDAGKCVGILATNSGSAGDYMGIGKVKMTGAPTICIPTTAGTGAEITDVAVLSEPGKKLKAGVRAPQVAPTAALLDPSLTLTLPAAPTRDSGLDALTHAIESYISVNAWPATDVVNLKAIELIGQNLRTAVYNGSNLEAREGMLTASLMAGIGFHNTMLCLVHAITGPLGGEYDLPHGGSNAIVLPHAMQFMLPGALEKYADIAVALGEDVSGLSLRAAAEHAVEAVFQLASDVELPRGLKVYGVKEEDLPRLANMISGSFMVPLSPRVATEQDILAILEAAL
jgi:alcohol dehydrogenase